jgi:hypothetical protein
MATVYHTRKRFGPFPHPTYDRAERFFSFFGFPCALGSRNRLLVAVALHRDCDETLHLMELAARRAQ